MDDLPYEAFLKEPETPGDYGRNVFTMHPFECVLINWPAGVASAVHHHQGLFGYVWVLEGELDNIFYREGEGLLSEISIDRYTRNGLIPEPDGVIHKLHNQSTNQRAVSLHFYFPAIESFEGMRIFNTETGDRGLLSNEAKSAFWDETPGHFKQVERKAFKFESFEERNAKKSHVITHVIPKPDALRVNQMNSEYFCEQAEKYDHGDQIHEHRKSYINAINTQIANDLKYHVKSKSHLDIAIGTGRRALDIKQQSGLSYKLTGVDISEEMCRIARQRGIETHHLDWVNDEVDFDEKFGSVTFLYAFGHLATPQCRLTTLQKINRCLHMGGVFYFDVFSINNQNEWGPRALADFNNKHLAASGYDAGDVFYRKIGFKKLAFIHYFAAEELADLLEKSGFEIAWIHNIGYVKNPGEIVQSGNEGNYFVKAVKIAEVVVPH